MLKKQQKEVIFSYPQREKEEKRQAEIKRKQENKLLAEKEMEELSKKTSNKLNVPTRRQIQEAQEDETEKILQKYLNEINPKQEDIEIDPEMDGINPNRQKAIEEEKVRESGGEVIDVTGLDQALEGLSTDDVDRHPEKRMKAVKYFKESGLERVS